MKLIDCLIKSLQSSIEFDAENQSAPACILWPDKERQWELAVPRLFSALPGLLVLGDYSPDYRRGPAIWLRCVLAGKIETPVTKGQPLIIYLPGVGYSELRAVENCPDVLKPLVELQYRGVVWSQQGYRDWSPAAFFSSSQGGVGLDIAQDANTKIAVKRSLGVLLDEDTDHLKRRLDADFFNSLLNTRDPIRDLLTWMDQGDEFWASRAEVDSQAFISNCVSKFRFDPKAEGLISAGMKLAKHDGAWQDVWKRFCESPKRYMNIPARIRLAVPPAFDLFSTSKTHGGWPQWNDAQEAALLDELQGLVGVPVEKICEQVIELDKKHAERRELVWAEVGDAQLAVALQQLAYLAKRVMTPLIGTDIEGLKKAYTDKGWEADDAALRASACALSGKTSDAVVAVIRALYLPWVDAGARKFQSLVKKSGYPAAIDKDPTDLDNGDVCVFFVDGLRFDLARRLADVLFRDGCSVNAKSCWAALPSVTATGKPAVSPVRSVIKASGEMKIEAFSPCSDHAFKKALAEAGWVKLEQGETGDGRGRAWCEFGNIDHEGHDRGMAMAKNVDGILEEIRQRVQYLIFAGWKNIRIVTDHGWVFMPNGLPKAEIQAAVIEGRGHRCALVKPGAKTSESLYPWSWDPVHSFASPDGVGCYRQGEEYAHGGLSLQECLTLELVLTCSAKATLQVSIEKVVWTGLRCTVPAAGSIEGITIDIRRQPADPLSSLASALKPLREDGTGSLVVEDEDLQGTDAFVVLLIGHDVVAQIPTIIGGGKK